MKNQDADVETPLAFNMNNYKILNLTQSFEINLSQLEQNYLQEQKKFHPDNASTDKEKFEFLSISTNLNVAYNILNDDYLRGIHLLKLLGEDLSDEISRNNLNSDFLTLVFNLSEKLEEMNNLEDLEKFIEDIKNEKDKLISKISLFFKNKDLNNAATSLMKLKYYNNLEKQIEDKINQCY